MKLPEYSRYVGRMKQPLQKPDVDNPTMYMISDSLKHELDLILLTPGTFLHAYRFITSFNAKCVRLFLPSLRPEFISDVFNLYMLLKDNIPIQWVFPEEYPHYSFSSGQIKTDAYQNQFNPNLTITYIENDETENVYDIVVRTSDSTDYFSFYLTEKGARDLCNNKEYTLIHIPKSSTLYGGLTYDSVLKLNHKYKRKLVPQDFTSIEELYGYMGREVPEGTYIGQYEDDPDNEGFPDDYTGDITDEDILEMLFEEGD
jgi:hypothetical protein